MVVHKQFMRFAIVGLTSNLALYLVYLLLTFLGTGHKTAMTLSYFLGVGLSFIFNRNWTFSHSGQPGQSLAKYVMIYVFGYLLNLAGLFLWVDKLGFDHALVQLVLIFSIAIMLFLLQKVFVFPSEAGNEYEPG